MASSLDKLSKGLGKEDFVNLDWYCRSESYTKDQQELLNQKGVYPYEYMSSFDRLGETALPSKDSFYSSLAGEHISDEEYTRAQVVLEAFDMKTMGDYHDLYLDTDVMLLADIMESFRKVCMANYGLDPLWYYTSPGLAWDACLKLTDIKLDLISAPDMYLFVEKGIRGGISTITKRYAAANNMYMADYKPGLASKFITYLDANNLYGLAMDQPLPYRNFSWMRDEELDGWDKLPDGTGCILEVDLEYPDELHDRHNEYPLAPERMVINGTEKLTLSLENKKNYVLHHRSLSLYLRLGMKLTRIHRGVRFLEKPWMAQYIQLNTDLRTRATTEFEKDFFKLMNNSVFGKTMENVRNRVDVRLVNDETKWNKLARKHSFKSMTIFTENLVAAHMKRTSVKLSKPIYLGMCILDLSKTLMYEFHYDYIKPKYGNRAQLLFTDTDSLCYEIVTEDFFQDISADVAGRFDTSNFPGDSPVARSGVPCGLNRKVIGMFKSETGVEQIAEFVGLRAKLYAYRMAEGAEEKKAK